MPTYEEAKRLLFFDTAWAIPSGIYFKLQKMFPEVKITLLYADEDWGNNCGFIQGKGEEIFAWPSDNESNVYSETLITFSRYIWEGDNAFLELEEHGIGLAQKAGDNK